MEIRIKTYIYALVASLCVVACSDDALIDSDSQTLVPMTVEAQSDATRTALSTDDTTVVWEDGDEIAVYDFQTTKHQFQSTESGDGRTKFKGQVTAKTEPFAAIYPYALAADAAASAATLSATLPTTQRAVADGFSYGLLSDTFVPCNISVAKGARNVDGSPSSITFHNVCQLLRFSVPQYAAGKVRSITFTAATAVAGTLTVNYGSDNPVTTIASSQSKTITLLPPSGSETFPQGTYNILCAPVRLSGFSMSFDCGTKTYSLSSTSEFGGQPGHVYSLGAIDLVNTPSVTALRHVYDANNMLLGTTLTVSGAPIEGRPWTVNIKNASGTVVRTLSVTGNSLTSDETDATWPYIPAGDYTVEYEFTSTNNRTITKSMPELTVPSPSLTLTVDAYTAHSKYEQGDAVAANACDRLTVYSPSAKLSVAPSLMTMTKYTRTFRRTLNGQTVTTTESTNSPSWANYTNVPVSGNLYAFSVTANFAGTSVSANKQVRITGLPANFTPPTQATGWSNDDGDVKWEEGYVRLGNASWSQPHRIKNSTWFNIPQGTYIALDYDIVLHRAAVNTTANVKMGDQEIVKCTDSKYNNDVHNTGIKQTTLKANATSVTCEGSYGSGATHTKVYKLYFKYGE